MEFYVTKLFGMYTSPRAGQKNEDYEVTKSKFCMVNEINATYEYQ
jgi:hypothetical protein